METVKWFGTNWGAPICSECPQVPVPIGSNCFYCEEPIIETDSGVISSNELPMHYNCFLRGIVGSVAHLQKRCSCFIPGAHEGDPPGLTKRQAADMAVQVWSALAVTQMIQ